MNKFEQLEAAAAQTAFDLAQAHATYYAQPQDREAATIAILMRALELAGGSFLLKPMENE